ncbi:MAG: hypothetical protein NVS2B7_37760 [Herpetosiphon sp.]
MQPNEITAVLNRPIAQELLARDVNHVYGRSCPEPAVSQLPRPVNILDVGRYRYAPGYE